MGYYEDFKEDHKSAGLYNFSNLSEVYKYFDSYPEGFLLRCGDLDDNQLDLLGDLGMPMECDRMQMLVPGSKYKPQFNDFVLELFGVMVDAADDPLKDIRKDGYIFTLQPEVEVCVFYPWRAYIWLRNSLPRIYAVWDAVEGQGAEGVITPSHHWQAQIMDIDLSPEAAKETIAATQQLVAGLQLVVNAKEVIAKIQRGDEWGDEEKLKTLFYSLKSGVLKLAKDKKKLSPYALSVESIHDIKTINKYKDKAITIDGISRTIWEHLSEIHSKSLID